MLFSIEAHATATPRTAARCIGPRPAFASCDQEAAVLPPWGEGIRYSSRRRSTHVALLTSKSDLTALVFLVKNMLNLRRLGAFVLGASLSAGVVHCDNASVIMQLRKRDLSARTRHVHTNLGSVYDAIDAGKIVVQHVATMQNPANTLTVAESQDRFRASVTLLSGHAAWTFVHQYFLLKFQLMCAVAHDVRFGGTQHSTQTPSNRPQPPQQNNTSRAFWNLPP